jgi:hypothetical protein
MKLDNPHGSMKRLIIFIVAGCPSLIRWLDGQDQRLCAADPMRGTNSRVSTGRSQQTPLVPVSVLAFDDQTGMPIMRQ